MYNQRKGQETGLKLPGSVYQSCSVTVGKKSRIDIGSEITIIEQHSPGATTSPISVSSTVRPPYSIYNNCQKRLIVIGVSIAAALSSMTTNIYLPALPSLADHFGVSETKANLTITTFLIFQGATPVILGGFMEKYGRRPVYVISLGVFTVSNLVLATSHRYRDILALRCFQAIGTALLPSLSQAVVADIITSAERGGYMGYTQYIPNLAAGLGPFLGGTLAHRLGWQSVFVFLSICSGIVWLLTTLFLPETCRRLAGNGSNPVPRLNQTLWHIIKTKWAARRDGNDANCNILTSSALCQKDDTGVPALSALTQVLHVLFEKELLLLTLYNGLIYGSIQAIATTIPSQFKQIYQWNTFRIGLVYLPVALGGAVAGLFLGKAGNWSFARHTRKGGVTVVGQGGEEDVEDFPFEKARLQVALPAIFMSFVLVSSWGWVLEKHVSVAVPFVLIFFTSCGLVGINSAISALVADTHPGKAGSAAAANNVGKFGMAAGMTAAIQPLVSRVGIGKACTILACLYICFLPVLLLVMWKGMKWRKALREKNATKQGGSSIKMVDSLRGNARPQTTRSSVEALLHH